MCSESCAPPTAAFCAGVRKPPRGGIATGPPRAEPKKPVGLARAWASVDCQEGPGGAGAGADAGTGLSASASPDAWGDGPTGTALAIGGDAPPAAGCAIPAPAAGVPLAPVPVGALGSVISSPVLSIDERAPPMTPMSCWLVCSRL
jgi:hypothetical protein